MKGGGWVVEARGVKDIKKRNEKGEAHGIRVDGMGENEGEARVDVEHRDVVDLLRRDHGVLHPVPAFVPLFHLSFFNLLFFFSFSFFFLRV